MFDLGGILRSLLGQDDELSVKSPAQRDYPNRTNYGVPQDNMIDTPGGYMTRDQYNRMGGQPQLQVRPARGVQDSTERFAPFPQGRGALMPNQMSFPGLQGQSFGRGQAGTFDSFGRVNGDRTPVWEDEYLMRGQQGFVPQTSTFGDRWGNSPVQQSMSLRDLLRGL